MEKSWARARILARECQRRQLFLDQWDKGIRESGNQGIREGLQLCPYLAGGRGSTTKGIGEPGDPWKIHGPGIVAALLLSK